MSAQIKIILVIVAALAVVGAAGVGLHYSRQGIEGTESAGGQQADQLAAAPPAQEETADPAATPAGEAMPPTFDIVRVEPDGSLVAAGHAASAAQVMLMHGDEELEKATANSIGEWAIVLAEPLAPGTYDLSLMGTGPGGQGGPVEGDRVTVVIDSEDKTPLVAVARPGQPTEVLQQAGDEEGETVVAAADAGGQSPAVAVRQGATQTEPDKQTAGASATAGSTAAQPQTAEARPDGQTSEPAGATARAQTAQPETQAAAPGALGADQQPADQPAPAPGAPAEKQIAAISGDATPSQAESAPAQPDEQPAGEPDGKVSIETVEVEDPGRFMLSGEAEPGDTVRLYLNNGQLADVQANAAGRWSHSSERPMPPGRYEVRADVVDDDGKVTARAEVRFDRVQIVAGQDVQPSTSGGQQGSAAPGSTVTIVSHAGGSGTASAGATVGEGAGTSVVVIARGDNLWRIARKIYGKGVRHSVIFEANKNQIRNPHLIYPGQVFTIPVLEGENG